MELKQKRLNLALREATSCAQFIDWYNDAKELQAERNALNGQEAGAGNFSDEEFASAPLLSHMTAYQAGYFFDFFLPAADTLYSGSNKDVILGLKK